MSQNPVEESKESAAAPLAAKPEDTKAMGRGLRIFSWVIGILVLGLAFLFLLFILTSHSSGRGFWRD